MIAIIYPCTQAFPPAAARKARVIAEPTLFQELCKEVVPCGKEPGIHGTGVPRQDGWQLIQDALQGILLWRQSSDC